MKTPSRAPFALVVDDDAIVRMIALDILEDAGFRTLEAENGDLAIPVLAEHHASVVLLFSDVHMPGTRDGFALAHEVAHRWSHISIVIASGHAMPGPNDLPEGARFIGKPFSADTVRGHIIEMLPDGRKPEPLRG